LEALLQLFAVLLLDVMVTYAHAVTLRSSASIQYALLLLPPLITVTATATAAAAACTAAACTTVTAVTAIDLGTEIAPVMSFAFEKPDDDVMLKQPRRAVVPRDVLLEPSEVADMERATHIEVRTLQRVTRRLL
jgi:hypothetical protein